MMLVDTPEKVAEALEFIHSNEVLAYDIESTGLNVRKDRIIGIGVSNHLDGFYIPLEQYQADSKKSIRVGISSELLRMVLEALGTKKLLCFNASFDLRFTKHYLGIDLLPSLHTDVLLLKHTCDEDFPFGLKEIGAKLYGKDVKAEKIEMQASIKANGGTATEYYKASTELLAKYCVADCLLTFRLYNHYRRDLEFQGLGDFFYKHEVMPLYKEVTIPMEEVGVKLDIPYIQHSLQEIIKDIGSLEQNIQIQLLPHLALFTKWFLNKDYPTKTYTGKQPAWSKKYASQYEAWAAENPEGFMFNLQSKHHLKKMFFDTLKEIPLTKTPTGQPQVNEDFLDFMAQKYPWAADLVTFNKLQKLKSTYIERFLQEAEDGIFYPSFAQHRTVSGRYAGDLQQLPRPIEGATTDDLVAKYTNRIRQFIIARPNSKLMSADYEQLEPRVFAHTSGDTALAAIFNDGVDFYSEIARRTEGLETVSKAQRQKAKSYALGIPYGMTGYKLKFEIGTDDETADALVRSYLNAFPKLEEWMNDSKDIAMATGEIRTQSGRVRHMPQVKTIYEHYGPDITNDLWLWKAYNDNPVLYSEAKAFRKTFKNLLNNAINFQVQGLAASILNKAMIAIMRRLRAENLKASIVASVHDEVVMDCPINEIDKVSKIVQDCMENTTKLTIPLKTKPIFGTNYAQCK